jgi:hypothetical protein
VRPVPRDFNAQFGVVDEFDQQLSASVDGSMGIWNPLFLITTAIFMREMINLSIFDYVLDSIDK